MNFLPPRRFPMALEDIAPRSRKCLLVVAALPKLRHKTEAEMESPKLGKVYLNPAGTKRKSLVFGQLEWAESFEKFDCVQVPPRHQPAEKSVRREVRVMLLLRLLVGLPHVVHFFETSVKLGLERKEALPGFRSVGPVTDF